MSKQSELTTNQSPTGSRARTTPKAMKVIKSLASLKLTVVLLVFGLFGVLTATLQLASADIWTVKKMHFPNPFEFQDFWDFRKLFVYIPFQTYFIPAWFPEKQNIPYGFYMPAGVLVIVAMMINLTAAHLIRFRLQATGTRLSSGILATLLGSVLVFVVVALGQNRDGIQDTQFISNDSLWMLVQFGIGLLAVVMGVHAYTVDRGRWLERVCLWVGSAFFFGLLVFFLVKEKAYLIDDSGMRIVWLMTQGTIAGLVLLMGCVLLFKRKGGIVLIHAGMMLLMLGELFTTYTAVESQMGLSEGESRNFSEDIRFVELAVVDVTEKTHWDEVMIPGWMLNQERRSSIIEDDRLPFDLQLGQFFQNSKLEIKRDFQPGLKRPRRSDLLDMVELAPVTGATMNGIDQASLELNVVKKGKAPDQAENILATIKASLATLPPPFQNQRLTEPIIFEGRTYQVYLRFRRIYKDYEIRLIDTDRELYVGTEKPRSFSSEFEIIDHRFGTRSKHKISMNNPLRYGNETFYQQKYEDGTIDGSGIESSGIQIVHNRGWMIPYVSCMIVGIGLIWHFIWVLFGFLRRVQDTMLALLQGESLPQAIANSQSTNQAPKHQERSALAGSRKIIHNAIIVDQKPNRRILGIVVPLAVFLLFLIFAASTLFPRSKATTEGFDLDQFGKIPVTCKGRTLPLDSLARNYARKFSHRESLTDGDNQRQPAIKWIADVMFEAPGHDEYQLFRIDEPSLLHALGLQRRKGFRYSVAEIERNQEQFENLLAEARGKTEYERTNTEKRAIVLLGHWNEYQLLRRSLKQPVELVDHNAGFERIEDSFNDLTATHEAPLILPVTGRGDEAWMSRLKWANLRWFQALVETHKLKGDSTAKLDRVSQIILEDYFEKARKERFLKLAMETRLESLTNELIEEALLGQDNLKDMMPNMSDAEYRQFVKNVVNNPPQQIAHVVQSLKQNKQKTAREILERQVELRIQQDSAEFFNDLRKLINSVVGKDHVVDNAYEANQYEAMLSKMGKAYVDTEVEDFNETSKQYLKLSVANETYDHSRINTEWWYNSVYPLFIGMILYITGFLVSAVAWIAAPRIIGRSALGIILSGGFLHLLSVLVRIYVSERAPVTNLYSSAVFIGLVAVALLLILELFVRMGICRCLAAFVGFMSLLVADGLSYSGDTIVVMQAVLDTNFWLSTHVVCISLGYCATLVAGMLGCAYIVASVLSPAFFHPYIRKPVLQAIYGVTCFAMIFSFVGTVLGGLWADDSWGRFWGWDPKENGALMIVLANALLLHARWCGIAKDKGIAILSVVGNIVTLWSWFAVNEMGIGLHSYGFTEGTMFKLSMFWLSQLIIIAIACIPYRFWISRINDPDFES